jgi:hypothetical protein
MRIKQEEGVATIVCETGSLGFQNLKIVELRLAKEHTRMCLPSLTSAWYNICSKSTLARSCAFSITETFITLVGRDVCHSNFKPAMRNQRSQAARNKRREQLENLKKAKEGGLSRTDLLEVRSCFFFVSLRSCSWMTGKMSSSCWMKMSTSN